MYKHEIKVWHVPSCYAKGVQTNLWMHICTSNCKSKLLFKVINLASTTIQIREFNNREHLKSPLWIPLRLGDLCLGLLGIPR